MKRLEPVRPVNEKGGKVVGMIDRSIVHHATCARTHRLYGPCGRPRAPVVAPAAALGGGPGLARADPRAGGRRQPHCPRRPALPRPPPPPAPRRLGRLRRLGAEGRERHVMLALEPPERRAVLGHDGLHRAPALSGFARASSAFLARTAAAAGFAAAPRLARVRGLSLPRAAASATAAAVAASARRTTSAVARRRAEHSFCAAGGRRSGPGPP